MRITIRGATIRESVSSSSSLPPAVNFALPMAKGAGTKRTGAEILHKHHQHAIHTNSDGDRWDATAMEIAGICWDSAIEIVGIN